MPTGNRQQWWYVRWWAPKKKKEKVKKKKEKTKGSDDFSTFNRLGMAAVGETTLPVTDDTENSEMWRQLRNGVSVARWMASSMVDRRGIWRSWVRSHLPVSVGSPAHTCSSEYVPVQPVAKLSSFIVQIVYMYTGWYSLYVFLG